MPEIAPRGRPALWRPAAVGLLAVLAVLPVPATALADDGQRSAAVVRFEADGDTVLELEDGRRFLDTLELRLAPDGAPVLVNELHMDDYLAGIEEMPPRWHGEALKAQAVAARTYVWRAMRRGTYTERGLGYDICATVACQVFAGTGVLESPFGARWRAAVRETSGEVLLEEDGGPILARYFSTSGGRLLPNEVAFPDSGPVDYLVGGDDPEDAISPLHRWQVEFTREEFDDILSRGETLAAAVPVEDVERRGDVFDPGAELVVTGGDGARVAVPAVPFRRFVSRVAADRHPERFPGPRADGRGRLPATLPSSRFDIEVTDDAVTVEGHGWGHGVGMGQYGARGKAHRGLTYDEILASYYNGLEPEHHEDVPERVRVGMEVADETSVTADGPVRIVADGHEIAARGLGRWRVGRSGGELTLAPPQGHDRDLEIAPTNLVTGLGVGADRVVVETRVNKPVELRLEVLDARGGTVHERDLGVAEPGEHTATWRYRDADGERVAPGAYRLRLSGRDAQGARDGTGVEHTVPAADGDGAEEPGTEGWELWVRVTALVAISVAGGVVALAWTRRSR